MIFFQMDFVMTSCVHDAYICHMKYPLIENVRTITRIHTQQRILTRDMFALRPNYYHVLSLLQYVLLISNECMIFRSAIRFINLHKHHAPLLFSGAESFSLTVMVRDVELARNKVINTIWIATEGTNTRSHLD